MTNEEAIDLLDNLIGMIEDNHNSDYDTAFKMGIEAIKQKADMLKAIEDIKAEISDRLGLLDCKKDILAIIDKHCWGDTEMSDFEIVSKDAKIDTRYGLDVFHVTKEEIAALLSGKKLYSTVNCGEYAITIEMKELWRINNE